jgi:hypothetical protein
VEFNEEQRFRQPWLWAAVVAAALAAWLPLLLLVVDDHREGPAWSAWLLAIGIGVGLPVLFALARLRVDVYDDRVVIRYRPFTTRTISFDQVVSADAVTYRPVREYGGWGIKGWSRQKVAYNMGGNRGVLITLADARTVLIGSACAEDLAAAIAPGLIRHRCADGR